MTSRGPPCLGPGRGCDRQVEGEHASLPHLALGADAPAVGLHHRPGDGQADPGATVVARPSTIDPRSEEHTSELQSRGHLVCRLLLEKKKKLSSQIPLSKQ